MAGRLLLSGCALPRPLAAHGSVPPRSEVTEYEARTIDLAATLPIDFDALTLPIEIDALTLPIDVGTTVPLGSGLRSALACASRALVPRNSSLALGAGATLALRAAGAVERDPRLPRRPPAAPSPPPRAPRPASVTPPARRDARAAAAPSAAPPRLHPFRREAGHALHGIGGASAQLAQPRASAYGWTIAVLVASMTLVTFAGAALANIEVTVLPGVLRAPEGSRAVESTMPGAIAEVAVRAGDEVTSGQVLARLAVAQHEATLASSERELAAVKEENTREERADREYAGLIERALRERRRALSGRKSHALALVRQRRDQLERMSAPVRDGVASATEELATLEMSQGALLEAELLLRAGLADVDVQLAETQRRLDERARSRRAELARASAAVAEARALVERATIHSPVDGRVESLSVWPGVLVEAGQLLAQVVPIGAPRSIVAFLPSGETALVEAGAVARVEVKSLPVHELGQALARVTRISAERAAPEELEAQLGAPMQGSFVRVELELLPESETPELAPHLRSGAAVTVRLQRRERRIVSLMFDFARIWFGQ